MRAGKRKREQERERDKNKIERDAKIKIDAHTNMPRYYNQPNSSFK